MRSQLFFWGMIFLHLYFSNFAFQKHLDINFPLEPEVSNAPSIGEPDHTIRPSLQEGEGLPVEAPPSVSKHGPFWEICSSILFFPLVHFYLHVEAFLNMPESDKMLWVFMFLNSVLWIMSFYVSFFRN